MITTSSITPAEIVRVLNRKALSQAALAFGIDRHKEIRGSPGYRLNPKNRPSLLWPGFKTAQNDEALIEQLVQTSRLRRLVDEWLDSGRDPNGRESPLKRDLFRTSNALEAVREAASRTPVRLIVLAELSDLAVVVGTPPVVTDNLDPYGSNSPDFFQSGLDSADGLFIGIIAADQKSTLCKCRHPNCGRYFLKQNPRRSYKRGTLCPQHQRNWTARRCMSEKRDREKSEWIEIAAQELIRRKREPRWQQDARQKILLANDVSRRISKTGHVITRKWITQNQAKIELQRVELIKENRVTVNGLSDHTLGNKRKQV